MAKANKAPKGAKPMPGSKTPMQTMIKGKGRMIDPRMAPCGDNTLDNRDNDGDEY